MLSSLLFAAPLFAQDGSSAQTTQPQADNDQERVVCRRERVVGSNRPQRVCMTRREWREASDNSQRQLREVQGGIETPTAGRGG